ncbi:hypothetical protein DNF23_56670, partial [Pseudomonas syringae pv. pisi]
MKYMQRTLEENSAYDFGSKICNFPPFGDHLLVSTMLETLAADLLSRFLGQYIEGLETKNISLGLWSGKLCLRSLSLRTEALSVFLASLGLDLGASVRRGEIE